MREDDPWHAFRVPEPKPEPGTFPPWELWKEFPPVQPAAWEPMSRGAPVGKPVPAADQQDRWSVPLTEASAGMLVPYEAPPIGSPQAKRLKLICSFLRKTANGMRSCNGRFTEQWLAERWAYLWNSGLGILRINLRHHPDDRFDPAGLFLHHVAEIGRLLDRVTGPPGLLPHDIATIHKAILHDLSYRFDCLDLRYRALVELHFVMFWTERALSDELEFLANYPRQH